MNLFRALFRRPDAPPVHVEQPPPPPPVQALTPPEPPPAEPPPAEPPPAEPPPAEPPPAEPLPAEPPPELAPIHDAPVEAPKPPPKTPSDPWDVWDGVGASPPKLDVPMPPARALESALDDAYRGAMHAGTNFVGVRRWQPGDDTRHVNWRATRRSGRVEVNDLRDDPRTTVVMIAEAGLWSQDDPRSRALRQAAELTGTLLAGTAARHRDGFGVIVYSDRVELAVAPARSQKKGTTEAIDALLRFRPRRTGTNDRVAVEELDRFGGSDRLVFVFSDRSTEEIQRSLGEHARRRRIVHVRYEHVHNHDARPVARTPNGEATTSAGWTWEEPDAPERAVIGGERRKAQKDGTITTLVLDDRTSITDQLIELFRARSAGG